MFYGGSTDENDIFEYQDTVAEEKELITHGASVTDLEKPN